MILRRIYILPSFCLDGWQEFQIMDMTQWQKITGTAFENITQMCICSKIVREQDLVNIYRRVGTRINPFLGFFMDRQAPALMYFFYLARHIFNLIILAES